MKKILLLALGGAIGTISRYFISGLTHKFSSPVFPFGTLAVNITGAFVIGFLWEIFQVFVLSPNIRVFLFVGILGGFTTFSAYALETVSLIKDGEFKLAMLNIFISNFLGIVMVFVGGFVSKCLIK